MGEKSDPRGGIRSQVRHNTEQVAANGFTFAALKYLVDNDMIDAQMAMLLMGGVVTALSAGLKAWSTLEMTPRVKTLLSRWLPMSIISLVLMAQGCAIQVGRVTPEEFTSITGETLIACKVEGIQFAFGDADICRNVEGGHVSRTFADMTLGIVRLAANAVAGFFSGLGGAGAGMQSAVAAPEVPATSLLSPPAADTATEEPVTTSEIKNPFLPDPE